VVQQHVIDGERLLAEHGLLVYRDAVRHHHERFDGRGYPDGRGRAAEIRPSRGRLRGPRRCAA
jgi:HD-GYP domain-containing protein (c-di-GMP phosphodiesterase class II)